MLSLVPQSGKPRVNFFEFLETFLLISTNFDLIFRRVCKAVANDNLSVCLSAWNSATDFFEVLYLETFTINCSIYSDCSLNRPKITDTLHEDLRAVGASRRDWFI